MLIFKKIFYDLGHLKKIDIFLIFVFFLDFFFTFLYENGHKMPKNHLTKKIKYVLRSWDNVVFIYKH